MGVVAPLCRSWTACRRLSAVRLVRQTIRADRSGNAGPLGPDAQTGRRWAVSICPQSNDKRRFHSAAGPGVDLGIVGCGGLGFIIFRILSEEPGLERRLGDSFRRYKENVPRWIPRSKPWEGLNKMSAKRHQRSMPHQYPLLPPKADIRSALTHLRFEPKDSPR